MTLSSDSAESVRPKLFLYSRLAVAAACAAIADWLFYDHIIGLSYSIFLLVLALVIVIANSLETRPVRVAVAVLALIAGLAPAIESLDLMSAAFGLLGLGLFALLIVAIDLGDWRGRLWRATFAPLMGPRLLFADVSRARPLFPTNDLSGGALRAARRWAVPLGLLGVFLLLFAAANPLIEDALLVLDPIVIWRLLEFSRMVFWAATLVLIWPVFHICRVFSRPRNAVRDARIVSADPDGFFGDRAIVNALMIFNALFAAQTALDIFYLWGGAALPRGMTYASYAHRGAYPLLAAALIAAAFALIAMRPGGPVESTPLIRPLTLAFVAQNALLVMSSILRLDLYVAAYSLTLLRAAAFIWMGLVAVGLALMISQILFRKKLSWLIDMNALSLILTLYLACFVNFPYVVAAYNVEHSRDVAGAGPIFDADYAASLGPDALPAIDDYLRRRPAQADAAKIERLRCLRAVLVGSLRGDEWRGWSFRTWRLREYLASEGAATLVAAAESPRSVGCSASFDD